MVACALVINHKPRDNLAEEEKIEDTRVAFKNREGQGSLTYEKIANIAGPARSSAHISSGGTGALSPR